MRVTRVVGITLVAIAVLCICIGRSNYERLEEIHKDVKEYQREHPVVSELFGVPLTDAASAEARSAASFAYSFTSPLVGAEVAIYALLIAGAILTWAGGRKGITPRGPPGPGGL